MVRLGPAAGLGKAGFSPGTSAVNVMEQEDEGGNEEACPPTILLGELYRMPEGTWKGNFCKVVRR